MGGLVALVLIAALAIRTSRGVTGGHGLTVANAAYQPGIDQTVAVDYAVANPIRALRSQPWTAANGG